MAFKNGTFAGVAVFSVIFGLSAMTDAAQSAPSGQDDAGPRINTAGKQRTLTQQMAKSVCYAMLGVDTENQTMMARRAAVEFETQLDALIHGSAESGFAPETNAVVRDALLEVASQSQPLTVSVKQLAAGDLNSVAMRLVIERNLPVLNQMNTAVDLLAQSSGQQSADPQVARTINRAGFQRSLSQKIAKDACFIAAELNREKSLVDLEQSIEQFSDSLQMLMTGNPKEGILPPPTPEIASKLRGVSRKWNEMMPLLQRLRREGVTGEDELLRLAAGMDDLLDQMHRTVSLWVHVTS